MTVEEASAARGGHTTAFTPSCHWTTNISCSVCLHLGLLPAGRRSSKIGSDEVGGVRARVLSFSGSGSIPIWFRLWVDDQGLVRKAEMRAQGHFMDHRYFAFDAPLEIERPVRA
jgi:hypothetical protein